MQDLIRVSISFPFWTAYRATLQIIPHSLIQIIFSAIFPVAGVVLIYLWITNNHTIELMDIGLLFLCFFFTPLITCISLFLARRRNPLSIGPFLHTFDDEGIQLSGESFSMSVKWPAIKKVVESNSFMFFFVTSAQAISLPIDQLQAAGCLESVRTLALSKVGKQ
ncbi:MAG: hypothetical protein CTY29_06680 [Methylobacter sp.]|nr:MAG: hypothetical protein CTY29_06680 [Methylobacter sp.]